MLTILGVFAVIVILFFIAVRPSKKRELEEFMGVHYAHRGFHSEGVPENSVEAFKRAVQRGYGIELDVQLTQDGVVVFHDDDLKRMCGIDKRVHDYTCEELSHIPLKQTEHCIHTLEQVLEVIDGRVPIIVELKPSCNNAELCKRVYDILKGYNGIYCIESFHPMIVRWFKKHAPHIARGQLSAKRSRGADIAWIIQIILQNMLLNIASRPNFIAYCIEDTNTFAFRIVRKIWGGICVAWTVRDESDMEDINFDLFIFEGFDPDGSCDGLSV